MIANNREFDFRGILANHISEDDTYVVIHSALHRFLNTPDHLKWPLLGALNEYAIDGKTILIATHDINNIEEHNIECV